MFYKVQTFIEYFNPFLIEQILLKAHENVSRKFQFEIKFHK